MNAHRRVLGRALELFLFVGMMLGLALLRPAPVAHAATFTVTNCGDSGAAGQLRTLMNAAASGDTINIPACTITITGAAGDDLNVSGDLDFTKSLNLVGAGAGTTIIDGGALDRVFQVIGAITVNISGVTVRNGNNATAGSPGGGIRNYGGTLTITNSTFSGNSETAGEGGGIWNNGTLTIANSTISGNSVTTSGGAGGGIRHTGGTLTITNSTFSGNSATTGAGIYINGGTLTITNGTFAGNSASTGAGGIVNGSEGAVTLRNTIVANNTTGGNCSGTITDGGFNLQFGGSVANSCGATITTGDPALGALGNNGGPTQTMAIAASSAALDKIPNASGCQQHISTDQRGIARPQPAGGLCDIGAYELIQAAAPAAPAAPAEVPEGDTLLLMGGGLGGLSMWLRWQWNKRRARK